MSAVDAIKSPAFRAVQFSPVEADIHQIFLPNLSPQQAQAFNDEFGHGGYRTEIKLADHILRPLIGGIGGRYELLQSDEEIAEDIAVCPKVTYVGGIVGNLILHSHTGLPSRYAPSSTDVVRVLHLHDVEARAADGRNLTEEDFPRDPRDIRPNVSISSKLKHVHVPLSGTVTIELKAI